MLPTIVLVHGAFAESSSWDAVIDRLRGAGHPVIAAANPLRGLATDAAAVDDVVRAVDGPVVLVAHSYGGAVISNVDPDAGQIVGLVYVNGFAPGPGESCFALAGKFPGSMLGETTLRPVPRSDGTTDLYIIVDRFHELFCADLPAQEAARMAATQRPATQEALVQPSGERSLWDEVPSWFLVGEDDRIIPAALQHFMADRAGGQRTIEIPGASHGTRSELKMSAMNTRAPGMLRRASEEPGRDPDPHDRPAASKPPTVGDLLLAVVPLVFFVPVAGLPAIWLVGPLLLLVLLLIPPASLLITLVVVLLLGAAVLFAFGVLIASPYLLVRHLHARRPAHRRRLASVHRPARPEAAVSEVADARGGRPVQQPGGADLIHLTTR